MNKRFSVVVMAAMSTGLVAFLLLLQGQSSPDLRGSQYTQPPPPSYPQVSNSSGNPGIVEAYGRLPLTFEANQGQSARPVKFLARGSGYTVFLTSNEAVIALKKESAQPKVDREAAHLELPIARTTPVEAAEHLRLKLVGANPSSSVSGADELPGKSNYFIGNDPTKWRTNVPTYAKVNYKGVYPGVDLVYYGNQRQLEYDFVVAPGANPKMIRLSLRGAEHLRIDDQGALVLEAKAGEVRLQRPEIYQEIEGKRRRICGRYSLREDSTIGFQVERYDGSKPLVIDPVLVYSTYLGGSGFDQGLGIAVDSAGNAYVSGSTSSTNFPTVNPLQSTLAGNTNAFISKINVSGTALVYSTYLGGSGNDVGVGIAVDSAGNAYVSGWTSSSNFPTVNALQSRLGGPNNAFISKINASGSALVYSTYLGGSGRGQVAGDSSTGIAVDSAGNAYVSGSTSSTNFPTVNPLQSTLAGNANAFISKINVSGTALVYSTYLGGSGNEGGGGIAVDSAGNVYVTGTTSSTNFPTVNALQSSYGGPIGAPFSSDAFVSKINASGTALVYSTYLGGAGDDSGSGIAVDSVGNAYVSGWTSSSNFPTVNALQSSLGGPNNAFISKINASGSALVYSTYLGGSGSGGGLPPTAGDYGAGIAVDSAGNAYVTGSTSSTNFPTVNAPQSSLCGPNEIFPSDAFVAKINVSGSALIYSTYLGGSGIDHGGAIAVDSAGNAYVTGSTLSTNFPTVNPLQSTSGNVAFISKLSNIPALAVSIRPACLDFSTQIVGSSSAPQTVTIQNTAQVQLTVAAISTAGANPGDFANAGDNCISSSPIAAGGSCTINLTFIPSATGTRVASLSVTDNASGSPQTVGLSGTGTTMGLGVPPGSSSSQTVSAGATAHYTLSIGGGGVSGTASLTCTGAPTGATCSVPASISMNAASATTFSMTVPTTSRTIASIRPFSDFRISWVWATALLGLLIKSNAHRRKRVVKSLIWLLSLMLVLLWSAVGCSGSGNNGPQQNPNGTPAGTYKLTVTATSGSITQTVPLSLTVQ